MKKLIIIWSLIIFPFTVSISSAGDLNFQTTKDGIIDGLLHPADKQKAKTRTINGSETVKTRGIKIVTENNGVIVGKTVYLSEYHPNQGVNLKINFDFDSYSILPESFALIGELGQALTDEKLKDKNIVVKGHTDSIGPDIYNLKLSYNRALAVKLYLIDNFSISPLRLKIVGYGESLPLVPNSDEANRQINRRVEIVAQ